MVANSYFSGQLLIATPLLNQDPFFRESVVYLIDHDDKGAMGLIINKPTDIALGKLFDELEINNPADSSECVLLGGPVQREAGLVLHQHKDSAPDWESSLSLDNQIALTSSTDILEAIGNDQGPEDHIIALGYASWTEGQLEHELQDGCWLVAPYHQDVLFDLPYANRWASSIEHLGVKPATLSTYGGNA